MQLVKDLLDNKNLVICTIEGSTGSGKTVMGNEIIKEIGKRNKEREVAEEVFVSTSKAFRNYTDVVSPLHEFTEEGVLDKLRETLNVRQDLLQKGVRANYLQLGLSKVYFILDDVDCTNENARGVVEACQYLGRMLGIVLIVMQQDKGSGIMSVINPRYIETKIVLGPKVTVKSTIANPETRVAVERFCALMESVSGGITVYSTNKLYDVNGQLEG